MELVARTALFRLGRVALVVSAAMTWLGATLVAAGAEPVPSRFFFRGDGKISMYHAHFGTHLEARFRRHDGSYDEAVLAELRNFFRSRTDDRKGPLSLRLVEILDFVEDRFDPDRLVLYSAYRSPDLNASLPGAARASLHVQGLAADVALEGVSIRDAWIDLRAHEPGGLGFYAADGFLHIDVGKPRFWEQHTSGVGSNLSSGNARIFARTEYDRYPGLGSWKLRLHGMTAVPVGLRERVEPGMALVPLTPGVRRESGCWWIDDFADEIVFELRKVKPETIGEVDAGHRLGLVLPTCVPRVESTPKEITANSIEIFATP